MSTAKAVKTRVVSRSPARASSARSKGTKRAGHKGKATDIAQHKTRVARSAGSESDMAQVQKRKLVGVAAAVAAKPSRQLAKHAGKQAAKHNGKQEAKHDEKKADEDDDKGEQETWSESEKLDAI